MRQFLVTHDADEIRIGSPRGYAARPAGIEVHGGTLLVDPLDPGAAQLVLTQPDAAQETVVALFGLTAWDLVTTRREGSVNPGWALSAAARLAILDWLGKHSPDELDQDLLDLEAVAVGGHLDAVIDPLPISQRARIRALEMAAEDTEASSDLGELARWALGALDGHRRTASWSLPSELTEIGAGVLLDGENRPESGWRTCGLDWDRVPRGAFSTREDALRWRVDGDAVVVRADCGWNPAGQYVARLVHPDEQMPAAIAPLTLADSQWVGEAALMSPGIDPDDCWIDVTQAGDPRPWRRGAARERATARRWASRAVTRLRFGLSQGYLLDCADPLDDAIGCLERARIAYADAEMASQRHLELGWTLLAALRARGNHHELDDLQQELRIESPGAPLQPPDLTQPGWELTVAERYLLVPEGPSR